MNQKQRELHRRHVECHIYVIEFSSGTVKVGKTNNQRKRLVEHAKAAQAHGVRITRSWVSDAHTGYADNELTLINFCAERWPVSVGREYFEAADFDEIVKFASSLPMPALTEAEIDEWFERVESTPPLVPHVWAAVAAAQHRASSRQADDDEADESYVLLTDLAPYPDEQEEVTAEGIAKHEAARALVNHHLRLKLNPHRDHYAWKAALRTSHESYFTALLLRELQEHAGAEVADAAARRIWNTQNHSDDDFIDHLTEWVTEGSIDPDALVEMAKVSYGQEQKLKAMRVPAQPPFGGES